MPPVPKPSPKEDADSQTFWQGAREGRLMLPRCGDCGKAHFYPRAICPHCHSLNLAWFEASGRGTIYSVTVQHRPAGPEFADDVPYAIALIDLDEGPRMLARIVETPVETVAIGQAVSVVFVENGETAIPCFAVRE